MIFFLYFSWGGFFFSPSSLVSAENGALFLLDSSHVASPCRDCKLLKNAFARHVKAAEQRKVEEKVKDGNGDDRDMSVEVIDIATSMASHVSGVSLSLCAIAIFLNYIYIYTHTHIHHGVI